MKRSEGPCSPRETFKVKSEAGKFWQFTQSCLCSCILVRFSDIRSMYIGRQSYITRVGFLSLEGIFGSLEAHVLVTPNLFSVNTVISVDFP